MAIKMVVNQKSKIINKKIAIPFLQMLSLQINNQLLSAEINSQAPDVPELADLEVFQLSPLSVNCNSMSKP